MGARAWSLIHMLGTATPPDFARLCWLAAAVQVVGAAVALTFLSKLAMMYEQGGAELPAATHLLLWGGGAPVWGVLLIMGSLLALAARRASNRPRSLAILVAVAVSAVFGLLVPILALLPLRQ